MHPEYVKLSRKMSADTFGCEESYFQKYIKGKPLEIVHSTPSHYVRVKDENEEEWGLFPGQYIIQTGLGISPPPQKKQAKQKKLLRPKTG